MQKVYRLLAWSVVLLGVLIGALRLTAIRWWQLPTNDPELAASVAPSLRGGDWILLWRLTRPGKGDLVVCPDPDDPTNVVVGRIAADANDEVVINGQEVMVNDHKFEIEYNCTERMFSIVDPDSLEPKEIYCDMENINDVLHKRGYAADERTRRSFKKRVESGRVFLLSDNRAHPFDSRHFGTLERSSCHETVFFRLVSKDGFFDVGSRLQVVR